MSLLSLQETIRLWPDMRLAFAQLERRTFPYTVQGLSNGLFAFFWQSMSALLRAAFALWFLPKKKSKSSGQILI